MPILERDPWRDQFFNQIACPDDVLIPTDDPDCWKLYPDHQWIYDKLRIAASQGLPCGPHGVMPERFPVFSKPIVNLKGMGVGSQVIATPEAMDLSHQPGHMWMEMLRGRHVSTDCAILDGAIAWCRHTTGVAWDGGIFNYWSVHASPSPALEKYLSSWVDKHMAGYTGMMNFETIGGRIIEAHLRFADQWCDLYGPGWVEALVRLYDEGRWVFDDCNRLDGFSIPLFARHGVHYRHPSAAGQARIMNMPHVKSLQITFFEDKAPGLHPMPPGGFRLGIVNATDLDYGLAARRELAKLFPAGAALLQDERRAG